MENSPNGRQGCISKQFTDEEVYVKQPSCFIQSGKEEKVYRLTKALYGLKQVPRAWDKKIDSFLRAIRFKKCASDHGLLSNLKMIGAFKLIMMKEFKTTDLGLMSYFLGIEVIQGDDGIFIQQRKFAAEFLKKFKMEDSNPKQSIVALSTCEAEYVATTTSSCQSIWLSNIMTQIGFNLDVPIKIYVDNVSAINLAKNPIKRSYCRYSDGDQAQVDMEANHQEQEELDHGLDRSPNTLSLPVPTDYNSNYDISFDFAPHHEPEEPATIENTPSAPPRQST
ncbi:uncharacterized protein [Phaseolus vulgaris]|uniref:uncharacterized protein n=1 Tax=Phaseolus vulgaris TaxID=3885 RepID=UPI0035CB5AE1